MQSRQRSIGRAKAIALAETEWWLTRTAREVAKFQLFTAELCMPFAVFQKSLEEALGRSVWTHELVLNYDGLLQELFGERDAPSMDEILDLLPSDKRWVLSLEPSY